MTKYGKLACLGFALLAVHPAGAAESPAGSAPHDGFHLSDLLPRSFQRNPRLEVSVLTELTPAGKALTPPDPAHPAYFAGWDGGLVEEGDPVAGERPPKREHLAAMMQGALAASGYLPATKENPPTIVIRYLWGSYNRLTSMPSIAQDVSQPADDNTAQPSDSLQPTDDLTDPSVRKNLLTRAALVGGAKFGVDLLRAADLNLMDQFRNRDPRNEDLVEMALGDLYFVVAIAYDANAARHGKAVALWTTKISTNSQGLAMDETLPTLATTGRRMFGHETDGPVLATPRLLPGKVEVGEPRVVKDGAAAPAPPAEPMAPKK